ncbi:hypothetical protein VKI21_14105 [Cyanobacterium aponinum UTEX 3222]|uniref:Uncharacterized protein n=1 Tax=Cyanobacterium aponinum (strain PCC 10605) TaxID=755178 RepID=K9Z3X9_CYAAP|nr:hypothetical protein [Cyanobacterium aponinum]AFZ53906.1 hypothetical protein Cyan10605_1804 [Cyanobacterium aponinum PCC 10605]WRL38341.1 hypothetical protein VKI22_17260 [Cyanobacterium aponinum UTEX 3221]WRL41174.1 hypothetical protein VKI21_14105 [Cyanobacterium aponinum UTEX 3222]
MVSLNSLKNLKQGGQPTKWKNTPTKAIRIPVIFEDKILAYAQQLDLCLSSDNHNNNRSVQKFLIEIANKIDNKEKGYKSNSASQLIKDLKDLIKEI